MRKVGCYFAVIGVLTLMLGAFACRQQSGEPESPDRQTGPVPGVSKNEIAPEKTEKLNVFVSLPPQAYFVERLGGDLVEVNILVGPGQSAHTYQPTPKQMGDLARARIFFRIGLPFEKALLPKIKSLNPKLAVVDTREGVELREMVEHHHEDGETHEVEADDEEKDPHIWLDPRRAMLQVGTMAEELARLDPAHAETYQRNHLGLLAELQDLDGRIMQRLAPYRGRTFLVYHPAYGYFADAYGLRQLAVETAGKAAQGRNVAAWVETARREKIEVVYVDPQFNQTTAQTIADEVGASIVPLNPLDRNYSANLEAIAEKLAEGFRLEDEGK